MLKHQLQTCRDIKIFVLCNLSLNPDNGIVKKKTQHNHNLIECKIIQSHAMWKNPPASRVLENNYVTVYLILSGFFFWAPNLEVVSIMYSIHTTVRQSEGTTVIENQWFMCKGALYVINYTHLQLILVSHVLSGVSITL